MPTLSKDRILPVAITQLKLCFALKGCGKIGVEHAFDKIDDETLYVYDDEHMGYSDWNNVEPVTFLSKTFKAKNPNKNTLVLLPLDGRIITGNSIIKGGVCDCALLTDKELSFVEFKTNATSNDATTVLAHAEKAKDQLWHTYDSIIYPRYRDMSVDIKQYVSIDFYIIFDTDLSVTGVRADFQNMQNDFLLQKHYTLFFENEKEFK